MTNTMIRGTTIRRATAALGIALAALTMSTTAQADRGDRGHRGRDSAVHASRDSQAHRQRNRGNQSARRDIRRSQHGHTRYRGDNRWHHGRKYGHYRFRGRPRRHAGFFPRRIFRPAPHYHGRPSAYRGHGCRVVRHVGFDHYGRKIITKRRVCYGRHGR